MWFSRLLPVLVWVLALALTGCGREPAPSGSGPAEPTPAATPAPVRDPQVELEAQGRFVYERNCLVCHGRWGDGRGEMAEGMLPQPGDLTRARFKFRSTPSGFLPTDEDLRRTIVLGVAGSSMPTFAHLSDRDLNAVIAYVKMFSRRWDDPHLRGEPVALPSAPEWLEDPATRLVHARHGQELFTANCAVCHGPGGHGDGPAAANLEDDAGRPAPPADLTTGLWKSGRTPADLFRTLTTGFDGTPMPSFGETLSADERWDLVSFLLTLPAAAGSPAR